MGCPMDGGNPFAAFTWILPYLSPPGLNLKTTRWGADDQVAP